jgi:hypothetical protein
MLYYIFIYITKMGRGENMSYYHYEVNEYDENKTIVKKLYFTNRKKILEHYKVSMRIIDGFISNPNYTSKKLPHIKILKCYKPVFKIVKKVYEEDVN